MNTYVIKEITQVLNEGKAVPGKFKILAKSEKASGGNLEAVQTYDFSGKLDSGFKFIPETGDRFLGEYVDNTLYIIKFLDPVPPQRAEFGYVPSWYEIAKSTSPGDSVWKGQSFSFIQMLRDGLIRIFGGPGINVEIDPFTPNPKYAPEVSKDLIYTKDRFSILCKNFILKTFGGLFKWSNFKEDDIWKSEFEIKAKRGNPESSKEYARIKMGSLTDSKEGIFKIDVNIEGSKHSFTFGDKGMILNSQVENAKGSIVFDKNGFTVSTEDGSKLEHKGVVRSDGSGNPSTTGGPYLNKNFIKCPFVGMDHGAIEIKC